MLIVANLFPVEFKPFLAIYIYIFLFIYLFLFIFLLYF